MEIPDVYRSLWRHKILIGVLTSLLVVGAYFFTKHETPIYTATSLVRVQQQVQNAGEAFGALQTTGLLAETYATIAQTTTIARGIATSLDGRIPYPEIVGHVHGARVQNLDLLNISVTSTSPARARMIANAAPTALRDFVRSTGTLHDEITVVQPASLPIAPTSPSLKLNLLIALMLGLILNAGIALAIESLGDRARSVEEIERLTGIPALTIIPAFSGDLTHRHVDVVPGARETARQGY